MNGFSTDRDQAARRIIALMTTPPTDAVLGAFGVAGVPVRLVGGAVRDAVLGLPVHDVDLATPAPPERVIALIEAAGLKAIPTGQAHGTITAVADGRTCEITTLRRDVETDGRHAVVAFTDDWREDAARRDFTINAMSADAAGRVYDHFGGLADLAARRVRFVGEPLQRLEEDTLRLLRHYRFFARYGGETPDGAAVAACRAMVDRLPALSGERVRAEMSRLLVGPRADAVWRMMDEDGVLAPLGLAPVDHESLSHLVRLEAETGIAPDWARRLAAAVHAGEAAVMDAARRLRLSNVERDRLLAVARVADGLDGMTPRRGLHAAKRPDLHTDVVLVHAARRGRGADWVADRLSAAGSVVPVLPIAGRDLLKRGVPSGPALGRLLGAVEAWWVAGDFTADRAACLAEAERSWAAVRSPAVDGGDAR